MADHDQCVGMKLLKNSKILVNVDEALQDVLVVTYALENRYFQGVLLDSSKRLLPPGISPPDILTKKTENPDEDKFHSIRQRFTYFQEKPNINTVNGGILSHLNTSKTKPTSKLKPTRMTVRLRPRQVLCSKCRSICNENSENVDLSKTVKITPPFTENNIKISQEKPTRSLRSLRPTLIPKLNRLQPNEITNAINGRVVTRSKCNLNMNKPNEAQVYPVESPVRTEPCPSVEETWSSPVSQVEQEEKLTKEEEEEEDEEDSKMVLRKKRSVGSMEDLWDENVFVEATKKARTTPVIKISFGSQGEGTVLKIPSKVQNYSESEPEEKHKTASAKAAKKALKKAKKEARRKLHVGSPGASPAYEALQYRRHRHKVKHKKKHKEERSKDTTAYSDMKERCLNQKLSISLRRLNANAYAHRSESGCSESGSSSSSSEETIPDFPPLTSPLPSPVGSPRISGEGGSPFSSGDVVWGKIQGFPWWPGKVVKICAQKEGDVQAHVAWYGSSTSSLIPCQQLSPFLESFKSRFNKRKKSGSYKEAIRQATSEASDIPQKIMYSPLRSLMSSPTTVHVTS